MNDGYSALGGKFEYLNSDCDYEKWSQYLINTLQGHAEFCTLNKSRCLSFI